MCFVIVVLQNQTLILWFHKIDMAVFPYATHSQHRVPLMPHTCSAVFPYGTHLEGRVPLMPHTRRAVFSYATHSQGRAAQLPEQGEAFVYLFSPLLVSMRGPGSHSARQLTDLRGGALMGWCCIGNCRRRGPLAATLAGQAGKLTRKLTIMQGGLDSAYPFYVVGVLHHTGGSTISTLSGQSSPPHGIPPDDSKGQLKFWGFSLRLVWCHLPQTGSQQLVSRLGNSWPGTLQWDLHWESKGSKILSSKPARTSASP